MISLEDINTFQECPRRLAFGAYRKSNAFKQYFKEALGLTLVGHLKYPDRNISSFYIPNVVKASKALELKNKSLQEEWTRKGIVFLGDFFNRFPLDKYKIVAGPTEVRAKISKSILKFSIDGIVRATENSIHYYYYSMFDNDMDRRNDATLLGVAQTLKMYSKKYFKVIYGAFHIISADLKTGCMEQNKVITQFNITRREANNLEMLIRQMEQKYSLPANPCPDKLCSARHVCTWGGLDV